MSEPKTTKWHPPEGVDFYRGKISEAERLMVQLEHDYGKLQKRLSLKTSTAKLVTENYVAAKKKAYDAMIHTLTLHIREARKLIKWIETGKQPT